MTDNTTSAGRPAGGINTVTTTVVGWDVPTGLARIATAVDRVAAALERIAALMDAQERREQDALLNIYGNLLADRYAADARFARAERLAAQPYASQAERAQCARYDDEAAAADRRVREFEATHPWIVAAWKARRATLTEEE